MSETKTEEAKAADEARKFKEWYEDNSTEWNKQRRGRYDSDPKYRALVLERNRKSRAATRKARLSEQKVESSAKRTRVSARWKQVEVEIDGRKVTLFSIGRIARRLGVSVQAIRLWERNGTIPPPSNAEGREGKDRLYSHEDVEHIRDILTKTGKIEKRDERDTSIVRVRNSTVGHEREVLYKNGKKKTETLYTVGVLAEAVGRTVVTLEHLERRGDLPKTPLRSQFTTAEGEERPGRRLYTVKMIAVVEKAFASRPGLIRGRPAWDSFKAEVAAGWQKTGVMQAALVATDAE